MRRENLAAAAPVCGITAGLLCGLDAPAQPDRVEPPPELVARFSRVDLDDETISGRKFCKTHFGVNWWVSRQWKAGSGWGHTWLNRFGTTGVADIFLTRVQWVL